MSGSASQMPAADSTNDSKDEAKSKVIEPSLRKVKLNDHRAVLWLRRGCFRRRLKQMFSIYHQCTQKLFYTVLVLMYLVHAMKPSNEILIEYFNFDHVSMLV